MNQNSQTAFFVDIDDLFGERDRKLYREIDAADVEVILTQGIDSYCLEVVSKHAITLPSFDRDGMSYVDKEAEIIHGSHPQISHAVYVYVPILANISLLRFTPQFKSRGDWNSRTQEIVGSEFRMYFVTSDPSELKPKVDEDVEQLQQMINLLSTRVRDWNESNSAKIRQRVESRIAQAQKFDWGSALGLPRRQEGKDGEARSDA